MQFYDGFYEIETPYVALLFSVNAPVGLLSRPPAGGKHMRVLACIGGTL